MARSWYIIHVFSGYEKKIERSIRRLMENPDFAAVVSDVKIPNEEVSQVKDGKKKTINRLSYPSYVFLEMDLPDLGWKDICSQIRRINGVTGFLGQVGINKPTPVPASEMKSILQKTGDIKADRAATVVRNDFAVGESVKIKEGPFDSFSGKIEEVNLDRGKLRVLVGIFGRFTPVEVDFNQVEKI